MKTGQINKYFIFLVILSMQQLAFASGGGGGGNNATSKYFSISPPMVVNITDHGRVRHLQVSIQLRLENPADANLLNEHKPAIQHELVMLLSGREAKDVRSTKGKETLRTEATEKLKKVLQESTGKPLINAVYFTAFVIQ